jgi:hypothetical protein
MENEVVDLETVGRGSMSVFDGYQMWGIKFRYPDGHTAWRVDSWPEGRDPVSLYWIDNGEFFDVKVHMSYRGANATLTQVIGKAEDMREDQRRAILEGIKAWEANPTPVL